MKYSAHLWILPSPRNFAPPTPTLCVQLPPSNAMGETGNHLHIAGLKFTADPAGEISTQTLQLVQRFAYSRLKNQQSHVIVRPYLPTGIMSDDDHTIVLLESFHLNSKGVGFPPESKARTTFHDSRFNFWSETEGCHLQWYHNSSMYSCRRL